MQRTDVTIWKMDIQCKHYTKWSHWYAKKHTALWEEDHQKHERNGWTPAVSSLLRAEAAAETLEPDEDISYNISKQMKSSYLKNFLLNWHLNNLIRKINLLSPWTFVQPNLPNSSRGGGIKELLQCVEPTRSPFLNKPTILREFELHFFFSLKTNRTIFTLEMTKKRMSYPRTHKILEQNRAPVSNKVREKKTIKILFSMNL